MEQNSPVMAKKVWSMVRAIFFMLKKGISKTKFLFLDLNSFIKHRKLAGKALHNLMFHHHHNWSASAAFHRRPNHLFFPPPPPSGEYEFSCSNSPSYNPLSLFSGHKKHHYPATATPDILPPTNGADDVIVTSAVMKALELLTSAAPSPSPALPGFGRSPAVRQLRVTDSPFPLSNGDEDSYVDEAAENFIMRFYNDLRRQTK